jgi:hypothetical protein
MSFFILIGLWVLFGLLSVCLQYSLLYRLKINIDGLVTSFLWSSFVLGPIGVAFYFVHPSIIQAKKRLKK